MDRLTALLTGDHAAGRRPWFASGYQGYPGAAGSLTNPAFGHLPAHMIAAGAELGMTPEETMAFAGARHRNVHRAAPPSYTQQVDAHAEALELRKHAEAAMLFDEGPKKQRRTNLALNSSITVPLANVPAGSAAQLTNTTLTNFRAYKYVVFSTGFFFSQLSVGIDDQGASKTPVAGETFGPAVQENGVDFKPVIQNTPVSVTVFNGNGAPAAFASTLWGYILG